MAGPAARASRVELPGSMLDGVASPLRKPEIVVFNRQICGPPGLNDRQNLQ